MSTSNFKTFVAGINIQPVSTSTLSTAGDLQVEASNSNKLTYNDGTVSSPIVTEASTASLSNKTFIDPNIINPNITSPIFTGSGETILNSSGTITLPNATDTLVGTSLSQVLYNKVLGPTNNATGITMASFTPDGTHTLIAPDINDTLVSQSASQVLTNKTINASFNTITNITSASINSAANIQFTQLQNLTSGHILLGNSSNIATDTAMTGDVTISNTGVTLIGSEAVTAAKLGTGAATSGQIFRADGSGGGSYQTVTALTPIVPTQQIFGNPPYYTFALTGTASVTAGATYTNNGHTFTILYTIATGSTLVASGTGAPSAGVANLIKSSGTGTSTIPYGTFTSTATYFPTPGNTVLYAKVTTIGGGGGGGTSGGSAETPGGGGGAGGGGSICFITGTALGSSQSVVIGSGGSGGVGSSDGAPGGTSSFGSLTSATGGAGGAQGAGSNVATDGSIGGSGTTSTAAGVSGIINFTGGSGMPGAVSGGSGGGNGGAGGLSFYCGNAQSSSATGHSGQSYGGGGSGAGGQTSTGGGGASGIIIIEEYYQ
jgi:hypothetical protein